MWSLLLDSFCACNSNKYLFHRLHGVSMVPSISSIVNYGNGRVSTVWSPIFVVKLRLQWFSTLFSRKIPYFIVVFISSCLRK